MEGNTPQAGAINPAFRDVHPVAPATEYKVYKRRWVMLAIFSITNLVNTFHWIQYSTIANIITDYYGVSDYAVDWLALVSMIIYIPLIFPVTYFLDKKGLRLTILVGALGTVAGAWIKTVSVSPDLFYVTFIGQTVVSTAGIFMYGMSARMAAVWFGPSEISVACSIGVVGVMAGNALGFVIPPAVVSNSADSDTTGDQLRVLFYGSGVASTALAIVALLFYQDAPPTPPSAARAAAIASGDTKDYKRTMKSLFTNRNFLLHMLAYSLGVGVSNGFSILLNQYILQNFEDDNSDAGNLGMLDILAGIVGSLVLAYCLDKYQRYSHIGIISLTLFAMGQIAFGYTLYYQTMVGMYLSMAVLGFASWGYYTFGYEYGAQLTYPEPESTSSGILVSATYIVGIICISFDGWLLRTYGNIYGTVFFCAMLIVALICTMFIRDDLRRKAVQDESEEAANTRNIVVVKTTETYVESSSSSTVEINIRHGYEEPHASKL